MKFLLPACAPRLLPSLHLKRSLSLDILLKQFVSATCPKPMNRISKSCVILVYYQKEANSLQLKFIYVNICRKVYMYMLFDNFFKEIIPLLLNTCIYYCIQCILSRHKTQHCQVMQINCFVSSLAFFFHYSRELR